MPAPSHARRAVQDGVVHDATHARASFEDDGEYDDLIMAVPLAVSRVDAGEGEGRTPLPAGFGRPSLLEPRPSSRVALRFERACRDLAR
jgi:hypothetical protein